LTIPSQANAEGRIILAGLLAVQHVGDVLLERPITVSANEGGEIIDVQLSNVVNCLEVKPRGTRPVPPVERYLGTPTGAYSSSHDGDESEVTSIDIRVVITCIC